jgi:tetratricopeptide (TPR) repeat protein
MNDSAVATRTISVLTLLLASALLCPSGLRAAEGDAVSAGRGQSYYHYALAHLYEQMADEYGGGSISIRQQYFDKALDNYKLALKADPDSTFLTAKLIELYTRSGRIDDAVAEANRVLERNPQSTEVRRQLAAAYRERAAAEQGKFDEGMIRKAIEQYEEIIKIEPADSDSLMQLAGLYRAVRDVEKAEGTLKKLLEHEPNSAEALVNLAMMYAESGDHRSAVEMLEKVRENESDNPRLLLMLGQEYDRAGEPKKAAEALEQAIENSDEDSTQVRRALAEALLKSNQLDKALEQYGRLSGEEPENPENHLRISQIQRERHAYPEAWKSLKRAEELTPDSLEILFNKVSLLEAEGKTKEAISTLEDILVKTAKISYAPPEKKNRAVFLEQLGMLHRADENYTEAEKAFRTIGELDPESAPRSRALIVDTYRSARQYEQAVKASEAAVKEFPDSRSLTMQYGSVLSETGNADKAVKTVKKLLDGGSGDREVHLTLAGIHEKAMRYDEALDAVKKAEELSATESEKLGVLFTRGSVLERAKRFKQAEEAFRLLLAKDPQNAAALNYLGYMLADINLNLDDAHDMIQKALDIEPGNGAYLDSLGWVYYRQEKLDLAERYLTRSLESVKRDPVVHSHLGDVYHKLGKIELAKHHWEKSLAEWRSSPAADQDPSEIKKVQNKLDGLRVNISSTSQDSENKKR